jgi:isopenicillin N synthase-like dioxygenase
MSDGGSDMELREIPIVDIKPYLKGDPVGKKAVANSVDHACRDIGFLIITGHGVRTELIEKLWAVSRKFFSLRIPLKSASDSEANRPAVWSKAAGGRSGATLEFLS